MPPPAPPAAWSWQEGGGHTMYTQQDSETIESQAVRLSFGPMMYVFDFDRMVQRNAQSGKERRIHRTGGYQTAPRAA
eukprot:gene6513-4945_t